MGVRAKKTTPIGDAPKWATRRFPPQAGEDQTPNGVELKIACSSSFMSLPASANSGVER
jgi:hypothetical protein